MSTPMTMTNCPSDETLAAFLDGRLDPEARRRVVEHLVSCGDCFEVITASAETRGTLADGSPAVARRITSQRLWQFAAVLALLVGGFFFWWIARRSGDLERLAKASEALRYRAVEARPSDLFPYRHLRPTLRSANQSEKSADRLRLLVAVAAIESRASRAPTVENLTAFGVAQLVSGDPNEAIVTLQKALLQETSTDDLVAATTASRNVTLLSALSAAHHERARAGGSASEDGAALDYAERAWQLQKTPATAWNRALTLEALHQQDSARKAWQEYLAIDPSSGWADEARKHHHDLHRPGPDAEWHRARTKLLAALKADDVRAVRVIVSQFTQAARTMTEDELLAGWADAAVQGDKTTASAFLRNSLRVGAALQDATDDDLLIAALRHLDARAPANETRTTVVIDGYRAYVSGKAYYRKQNIQEARRCFAEAEAAMLRAHSPFIHMVRVYQVAVLYYENRYTDVVTYATMSVDATCRQNTYHAACALSEWMLGLGLLQVGRAGEALASFTRSRELFERMGEYENGAAVAQLRAETLTYLGSPYDAWADRQRAMSIYGRLAIGHRPAAWVEWAKSFLASGAPRAATAILNDVAADAFRRGDGMMAADALCWRAIAWSRVNAIAASQADLRSAERVITQIPDVNIRRRSAANLSLARAEIMIARGAVRSNDIARAETFFNRDDHGFLSASVQLLRARRSIRSGELQAAVSELREGIRIFEHQRLALDDPLLYSIFTERGKVLLQQCTMVFIRLRRFDDAWSCSERYREVLNEPETAAVRQPAAASLHKVLAALPADVTLLQQDLIEETLVTWVIRRGGAKFEARKVCPAEISAAIGLFRDDLQRNETTQRHTIASAQKLYRLLFGTVDRSINSRGTLIYLPSGVLRSVPLVALHDGKRFLISRQPIAFARSVRAVLNSRWRAAKPRPHILLVGEPASGRSEASYLPNVQREIDDIATLYGRDATIYERTSKEFRIASLDAYDILHFAGHAQRGEGPFRNALLFDDGNLLYASEILRHTLHRLPLVVLGGCSTADESASSELVVSLSAAFLASGASAVVGSLWAADDSMSRDLLTRFHEVYAVRHDAVAALQEAQQSMLAEGKPAIYWSMFEISI